jgi:predicted regulator of Ras-like GTPase activity (Roadblock/LC7/MglB family)
MAARSNTIVLSFDPASPRISAFEIHEWLHDELRVQEQKVTMVQIEGIKRQVYVKLTDRDYMLSIINDTKGRAGYKHAA